MAAEGMRPWPQLRASELLGRAHAFEDVYVVLEHKIPREKWALVDKLGLNQFSPAIEVFAIDGTSRKL